MGYAPEKIRNILLAGHSSAGKTSFAEALLFLTKSSDRFGSVANGTTVMDFEDEEIRRKASISLAVAPLEYNGVKMNLLDAPGLFDFELGMYEGIQAAEGVAVVLSARSGVSVGTEKAFKLAKNNKRSIMFYVGSTSVENADFRKTFSDMEERFGSGVCPVVFPVIQEGKPTVFVDLLENKAYTYQNGKATEVDVPDTDGYIDELLNDINEAVAEVDDELMEKFFMDEPFTHEELVEGIKKGTKAGTLYPVIAGDSITLEGIDLALKYFSALMPAPSDEEDYEVTDKDGNAVELKVDPNGPLVAYVFRTVADPFVGKLSFVKVLSGKLADTSAPVVAATGESERPGKLLVIRGKKQIDTKEITAGDIGAVTKLSSTHTGDTLCEADKLFNVKQVEFPKPTMSMAIYAANKGDEGKISSGIQKLLEEDRTVTYHVNSETSQQIISGLGEQHLEVVVGKLKSKFGVEVGLQAPRIAYRETIRGTAEAEGKHKKQSGGAGQFGVVEMRFEPLPGEDFEFVNAVVGGTVPKEFIPAVEKGIREAMLHGVLAGYPMVGFRATLYDGKYHPVDSKEVAFKSAARLAYKAACANAKPTLLEPICTLKAYVPNDNTGDIMSEVTKRRGRVLGMNPSDDGLMLVEAEVPEAEMQDFTAFMRSSTQGRGTFSLEFLRYDPLPSHLEAKVIADAADLREEEEE
ncbi:MAG: elongation factor G [Oscillospiraceae bacterium]|nr:elongation factor G [Oscillospiraceae bacterium]